MLDLVKERLARSNVSKAIAAMLCNRVLYLLTIRRYSAYVGNPTDGCSD